MNFSLVDNQVSLKTSLLLAVYRLILQMSPARPFNYAVNPLKIAVELGINNQETKGILNQLASEGILFMDQTMTRAYLTPKAISFLQKLI